MIFHKMGYTPGPVPNIYGVEWDWTSSGPTAGTRTDDAVGFANPSPAVNRASNIGSSPSIVAGGIYYLPA